MSTDLPIDESVFNTGGGGSQSSERKRHRSADVNSISGIFCSRRLSAEFRAARDNPNGEDGDGQKERGDDEEKDALDIAIPVTGVDEVPEAVTDSAAGHSGGRTPVLENDPLGLYTLSTSNDAATDRTKLNIELSKQQPGSELDSDDTASPPSSPDCKPLPQSQSDHRINASSTPPAVRAKAATLPAASSKVATRQETLTGVLHTAATGFMSRFRQLKDSVSTTLPGTKASNTSLPKAHEMDKHLNEEVTAAATLTPATGEKRSSGSLQDLNRTTVASPIVEVTTYEEHMPSSYKNRMKQQLQKGYSPFGTYSLLF